MQRKVWYSEKSNIHTIGISKGNEKEIIVEVIFDDIWPRILQNVLHIDGRRITTLKQDECKRTKITHTHLNTHTHTHTTLTHIIVKLLKSKIKILKEARGKKGNNCRFKFNIQSLIYYLKKQDIFRQTNARIGCLHHPGKEVLKSQSERKLSQNKQKWIKWL